MKARNIGWKVLEVRIVPVLTVSVSRKKNKKEGFGGVYNGGRKIVGAEREGWAKANARKKRGRNNTEKIGGRGGLGRGHKMIRHSDRKSYLLQGGGRENRGEGGSFSLEFALIQGKEQKSCGKTRISGHATENNLCFTAGVFPWKSKGPVVN